MTQSVRDSSTFYTKHTAVHTSQERADEDYHVIYFCFLEEGDEQYRCKVDKIYPEGLMQNVASKIYL